MARPEGLEPPTTGLEGRCSIQLSYGRGSAEQIGRGSRIRTCDPLLPKQMRYQTAPCPDGTRMLPAWRKIGLCVRRFGMSRPLGAVAGPLLGPFRPTAATETCGNRRRPRPATDKPSRFSNGGGCSGILRGPARGPDGRDSRPPIYSERAIGGRSRVRPAGDRESGGTGRRAGFRFQWVTP
jgi:hypothetical protein